MFWRGLLYLLFFLFCVAVLAKVRSPRTRLAVLLIASYALYFTWGIWFVAALLFSTLMNFVFGKWLLRNPSSPALAIGILFNLALLSTFKYLPPIVVALPFSSLQKFSHLALPVGMSFWTFQAMSYLFDLYREEKLDPSLFEFALYLVFFPVTIAGPICRMPDMLPQFRSDAVFSWDNVGRGLRRIATGVLMMQVAKILGQGILGGDGIRSGFDHLTRWSGADVWCLAFGYGLQLFFDFAGYSHIAIGAAQALGFTLPENFARPFQSKTPSAFWIRWHMSLSFWIRDYVFLPLAVMRRELWWRNFALVLSMVLFGLWHKASLLFLLWGCYHGVLLILHRQVQQFERRFERDPPAVVWNPISWIVTMALINLGWIFFRANSSSEARQMFLAVASPASYGSHFLSGSLYLLVLSLAVTYAIVLLIIEALARHSVERDADRIESRRGLALIARWRWFWIPPLYALALIFLLIVTVTSGTTSAQMMYGNF